MGKRTAVILLFFFLAALTLIGYFLHQSRKSLLTDPYKAIAQDACFIIETADIQSLLNTLTTGKGIFSEVGKIDEFRNFDTKLKYVADQLNKPGFKKLSQEGKTLISFHPADRKAAVPLISMTIPADAGFRQVREALVSFGIKNIEEEKTSGKRIIKLPYAIIDTRDTVFLSISSGLLVCSTPKACDECTYTIQAGADKRVLLDFGCYLATEKKEDKFFMIFGI